MKTVVIIENEAVELKALVGLFEHWQKEINVLTAREERAAITIMSQQQVDLVVCDLSLPKSSSWMIFLCSPTPFPIFPALPYPKDDMFLPEEAMRRGASHCLEKPVDTSNLLMHAGEVTRFGDQRNSQRHPHPQSAANARDGGKDLHPPGESAP